MRPATRVGLWPGEKPQPLHQSVVVTRRACDLWAQRRTGGGGSSCAAGNAEP